MPIKAENLARYPKNWAQISARIRFERAANRCECEGECGTVHDGAPDQSVVFEARINGKPSPGARCDAIHGKPHPVTGSTVVLTTAHLDHTPENVEDSNLKAMCQACHLRYDGPHHRKNAEATRRKAKQNMELFDEGEAR